MNDLILTGCKGCLGDFDIFHIADNGYCESCDYQPQAHLDTLTGEDDNA